MKPIFADFNAMTGSEHLRLNCRGSHDDLRDADVGVGDWAWLSDGELVVGARVADDPVDGVVGVPGWDTLVHLDTEDARNLDRVWAELLPLLGGPAGLAEAEPRIFQLLTILEVIAPPSTLSFPNTLTLRKASALYAMGHPGLALMEIEEARRGGVALSARFLPLYLEILRIADLPRAIREAETNLDGGAAPAMLLAACIKIWATQMIDQSGGQFEAVARLLLDAAERFEFAPGREEVHASSLAHVYFHQGLAQLRLGARDEARRSFKLAYLIDPADPALVEARELDSFGPRAREIASRVRFSPFAA